MSDKAHFHLLGHVNNKTFAIGVKKIVMKCTSLLFIPPPPR